ncbi:MAG: acyl-CoA/acyl-ACP dehydrogenase [Solirubrobacterales bacterium]|nr:acyl-CoA/acyl-ACP dehydrogenase [Solirubrobacterales bacterium]
MNFDLSEDQREIKRTARDLLADRCPPERVRAVAEGGGPDGALAAELAELGWPGIAIPAEHDGLGLGAVEAAALLEELGYALAGAPLLATAAAAFAIEGAGSDAQRAEWLPRLAAGSATATLGIAHGDVAALVADAEGADAIVLVQDGRARLLTAAEAEVSPLETIDPTRRYARVGAPPGAGEPLPGDPAAAVDRAAALAAAELVGVCQRALDDTVAYVGERRQFGRPIGSFQAVAHRCSDMLLAAESARSAAYFAAWSADADPDGLPFAAALAHSVAATSAREATASAIQAHGGVGFTWEADVHWLYKRAQVASRLFGSVGAARERIAGAVAARG